MWPMKNLLIPLALIALYSCANTPGPAPPQQAAPVASTEILVQSNASWDGGDFSYPGGDAQLTVVRILIPEGVALPMHCHPVPLGGVLTKGVLEVEKENGNTLVLYEGQGLIEVSNQWHHGRAVEDVEIMVVYAGAQDTPVTVLKDGDPKYVAECF
jgi:quercetin dioxygenase-like cupin family protein